MAEWDSTTVAVESDEPADDALIQQVLGGNTALFELLIRRYNQRVYRAVRSIVRDDQEAEDVMQQVYVNAFTHLRQFNGSARFSTWLTRIAINEALARVRLQDRYQTFDDERSNVQPFMFMSEHPAENPERQSLPANCAACSNGPSTVFRTGCARCSSYVVKTRLSRGRATLRRLLMERTGATAPIEPAASAGASGQFRSRGGGAGSSSFPQ